MATALLAKPGNGRPPPDKGKHNFTITGDVAGLVPLVDRTIEVTVGNKERFDIMVDSVEITVGDASPDCGGEYLIVGPAPLPAIIPGRSDATLMVTARLAHDVPDACQGMAWPLTYIGAASRP
jgi:hypothetical protein